MALFGRLVNRLLKQGSITFVMSSGSRHSYGPGGGRSLTVRCTDRRVPLDILRNPRLKVGEAYMDGRLVIEDGTILDLLEMVTSGNRWEDGGRGLPGKGLVTRARTLMRRNSPRRSRRNVAHHYDIGNALYELFLDDDWQYSCAYYTDPANSLEQAQFDKKAHIAAKLFLKPGQRVLDIGCGWGGMALYLNLVADVDVLGITLSEEQLKVARRRAEDAGVAERVRFELLDYRALDGQFDRIVSVGMFEHVGLAHYDAFYAKCRDLLKPDGVMLLHTIGKYGTASMATDPFTDKWIFPGYHLPSLSQMAEASQKARLISSDVETLRLHYAYTLRAWLERFTAAREKIVALYDERFFRMFEFYLAGGIVMFETGAACNYQVQYIRERTALPITRDYMLDAERELKGRTSEPARPQKAQRRPRSSATKAGAG
jgi:cyclopropane-fatty-acyl-phospholipid synthase